MDKKMEYDMNDTKRLTIGVLVFIALCGVYMGDVQIVSTIAGGLLGFLQGAKEIK